MTRILSLLLIVVAVAACNKPSDSACRKAISNMRSLLGTDSPTSTADIEGDVRRCKGGSTKKAVECAGNAKSLDELRACDFMKIPASAGTGSAAGSAAGSAMGSAAGSAMGSAAGSADTGSAAAGSASGSAGSASGSAGPASGSAGPASGSAGPASGSAGPASAGSASGSAAGSAK